MGKRKKGNAEMSQKKSGEKKDGTIMQLSLSSLQQSREGGGEGKQKRGKGTVIPLLSLLAAGNRLH